jgi:acetyl-CoA synthetase
MENGKWKMVPADPTPHLERFDSYEQACREFRWLIPQRLNIASTICRRPTDAVTRIALSDVKEGGINTYTFGGLDFLSDKFATALSESGISQGDSVAVVLPPSAALAIAHLGALKTGAVVVPLSMVSDAVLLQHALADSTARALVVDESIYGTFEALARNLPNLESRFVVGDLRPSATNADFKDFWSEVDRASSDFDAAATAANSAALTFYVESQGEITGVVHSHRSIMGQLTAFEIFNNEREADAVLWTAGEWCSPSVVLGLLYPAWWYGCSLVAGASEDGAGLQSVTPNEAYGKPETGWISGRCERWFASPAGSVGRPVPGRSVEIIDQSGHVLPPGHSGHIAVHKSDPGLFIGYHGAATRTAAAFIGDWFLTGDVGYKNGDGDLYIPPSPLVGGANESFSSHS